MVIPSAGFDPAATLAAVEQERCTALYGVRRCSSRCSDIRTSRTVDVSSLRTASWQAPPARWRFMKRCVDELNMTQVSIAYGMTETSPVSCQTLHDDDLERRTATVGRAHPHVEIKIVDPETGAVVERRCDRRILHSRLLGHARLLERRGQDPVRRSTTRAGCTPAIWP